jgi:Bacterial virulence factor lipase N-terminal
MTPGRLHGSCGPDTDIHYFQRGEIMHTIIRRLILALPILFFFGCSDSTTVNTVSTNAVLFDPTTSSTAFVPLPNILASATARDPLTNYISPFSSYTGARPANTPMTPPEALSYVNKYEMGSTSAVDGVNAPIYIRFTAAVDPATVTASNIKVFQITADSASTSATENSPLGFTDITGMFTFQYKAGSTDLFISPNFPLQPATRYIYVVTSRVKDVVTGESVASSTYFNALKIKSPDTLIGGPFAALEPVRANTMSGTDIKLSGYSKVMDDLIAASATTTVSSRTDIALMGRFITTGAGFTPTDATNAATNIPVESALRAFAANGLPGGLGPWSNAISGTATIPPDAYWSAVMGTATTAPATVGTVVTGTINSADLSIDPVVKKANSASIDLTGVTGAYNPAAGFVQQFRSGAILEGFYYSLRQVPFVYIAPTGSAPTGGWPLVIFQHGITGQKEHIITVAQALTGAGYAVVAIDLPLHGALAVPGHNSGAEWGQDFMAVGAPLATRSNIQQGAFNLDRLEFTVATGGFAGLGSAAPALTGIKFVGVSLGSIVGTTYLAGNTVNGLYPTGTDMKGFLSVPGGRLAYLIQNSPSFSTSINAGLAAMGIPTGSPTYNQFFQLTQAIVDPADPATMTTPLASGIPSRLAGRIAVQEATSTTFDAAGIPTNGDLVITNPYTRYFGNALGGRGLLGPAGATVAPGFSQLGYLGAATPRIPSLFMLTLAGASPTPKTGFAAALADLAATSPTEGYFQFDQAGITHAFLIDPTSSASNTSLGQIQMVSFLARGVVVDPTGASPAALAAPVPSVVEQIRLPKVMRILGY